MERRLMRQRQAGPISSPMPRRRAGNTLQLIRRRCVDRISPQFPISAVRASIPPERRALRRVLISAARRGCISAERRILPWRLISAARRAACTLAERRISPAAACILAALQAACISAAPRIWAPRAVGPPPDAEMEAPQCITDDCGLSSADRPGWRDLSSRFAGLRQAGSTGPRAGLRGCPVRALSPILP